MSHRRSLSHTLLCPLFRTISRPLRHEDMRIEARRACIPLYKDIESNKITETKQYYASNDSNISVRRFQRPNSESTRFCRRHPTPGASRNSYGHHHKHSLRTTDGHFDPNSSHHEHHYRLHAGNVDLDCCRRQSDEWTSAPISSNVKQPTTANLHVHSFRLDEHLHVHAPSHMAAIHRRDGPDGPVAQRQLLPAKRPRAAQSRHATPLAPVRTTGASAHTSLNSSGTHSSSAARSDGQGFIGQKPRTTHIAESQPSTTKPAASTTNCATAYPWPGVC